MKWSLLLGFVAVLVLGVPSKVAAGAPNVTPPTGASSGGYFTGTYYFETYINCQSGLSFSSNYSNSLEGTHVFNFDSSNDGSLLVRIDGGGDLIIYSCGDPTPTSLVTSYTVSKDSVPPSVGIVSPPNGSSTTYSAIDVTVSAGDSTSGIGQVSVNGVGASFTGGQWHATVGLNIGSNTLTATAVDRAGHSSTDSSTVTRTTSNGGGSTGGGGGGAAIPNPPPAIGGGSYTTPTNPSSSTSPTSSPDPSVITSVPVIPVQISSTPAPKAKPIIPLHPQSKPKVTPVTWPHWLASFLMSLPIIIFLGALIGIKKFRNWIKTRLNSIRIRLSPFVFRVRMMLRRGYDIPRMGSFSHSHHTGKILAKHHTSYPALAFILMCTAVLSGAVAVSSHAATSESTLSLTVLGPPPSNPAYISSPLDGASSTNQTILVKGTCPIGLVVELYRDGAFAGSSYCDGNGLFSLTISLNSGINTLVARDVDGLGQYGPDSNVVHISYTPPPSPTPTPAPTASPQPNTAISPATKPIVKSPTTLTPTPVIPPLILDTDQHYLQGISPGQPITWQLKVIGGSSPFAVTWNWGDGNTDKIIQTDRQSASPSHTYKDPGFYHVTVTVKDAKGQTALLQLLVVVNGSTASGTTPSRPDFGFLIPVWPLLAGMSLLVLSFWLGEKAFQGQHPSSQPAITSTA